MRCRIWTYPNHTTRVLFEHVRLAFSDSVHHLQGLTAPVGIEKNCLASSLRIMGKPLIAHNIMTLNSVLEHKIDTVFVPNEFKSAANLVHEYFPNIYVKERQDKLSDANDTLVLQAKDKDSFEATDALGISTNINGGGLILDEELTKGELTLPINSILWGEHNGRNRRVFMELIIYPWHFLRSLQKVLSDTITETKISPSAKVSKMCILDGPCIIEDDVILDDFCKIKGPAYISKGSVIGMCSLVRNSILGENTKIGFNCEVAKSYFLGNTKIAHQNVILDSIVGNGVWFGGYSATANVLITRRNVRYKVEDKLVDTGTDHFGAVVGNNSTIGANVLILPGRQIPSGSMIQAGTIISK